MSIKWILYSQRTNGWLTVFDELPMIMTMMACAWSNNSSPPQQHVTLAHVLIKIVKNSKHVVCNLMGNEMEMATIRLASTCIFFPRISVYAWLKCPHKNILMLMWILDSCDLPSYYFAFETKNVMNNFYPGKSWIKWQKFSKPKHCLTLQSLICIRWENCEKCLEITLICRNKQTQTVGTSSSSVILNQQEIK